MNKINEHKTAIIIGAGPAGLTAAYKLLKETDIKPIIFEASNEIGGISKTVQYKGNRMDIGGHRFFTKVDEVNALWNEILPKQGKPSSDDILLKRDLKTADGGPDPEKENEVMLTRTRVSRIYYLKKFFDYPISLKLRTFINMGLIRTVKAGFGYIGSVIHKRKEDSLENFYINRFGKPLYSMFFEKYTEKVWGRHPSQIDASWGAQRVKGLSLLKTIGNAIAKPFRKNNKNVETSLIESFSYPKYGPGFLYETMAKKIKELGGTIQMESEIVDIKLEGDTVKSVGVKHEDKVTYYEGDYFISSMPLKDLANAIKKENMPKDAFEVANGLVYRDFLTVGLLLNKLSIENETKMKTINNRVPDTWIYVQEDEVRIGRIQVFNNWSPYLVKDNLNTVWIGLEYFVNEGDKYWNMPEKDFIKMAIDEVEKIGVIKKEDVIDSTEVHIKKAYPAYFDTYKDIDILINYLNTISNLYCVGRNGQHRYNNMDHSMLCSIEAVRSIIDPVNNPKENIWKVNTEKEYHEVKK